MAAIHNCWMAGFERGCGETLVTSVGLTIPFGPIKDEYDDIRLEFFTLVPSSNCLHSAGND